MLCGEVLVKHPTTARGQPWIIDTMLCGEVLGKHLQQLGTALDH